MAETTPSGALSVTGIDITGLAKQAIAVEIAKALSQSNVHITKLIGEMLFRKVNEQGNTDKYSSYNTIPWIEWQLQDIIRAEAKVQIVAAFEAYRPQIAATLAKTLAARKTEIAEALTSSMVDHAKSGYGVDISVKVTPKSR